MALQGKILETCAHDCVKPRWGPAHLRLPWPRHHGHSDQKVLLGSQRVCSVHCRVLSSGTLGLYPLHVSCTLSVTTNSVSRQCQCPQHLKAESRQAGRGARCLGGGLQDEAPGTARRHLPAHRGPAAPGQAQLLLRKRSSRGQRFSDGYRGTPEGPLARLPITWVLGVHVRTLHLPKWQITSKKRKKKRDVR